MMNYPQWRTGSSCPYKFNIYNSSLNIFGLDADEDSVRADRLHRPHDILVGESRCLSPFRLSGEEDEIVYGGDVSVSQGGILLC